MPRHTLAREAAIARMHSYSRDEIRAAAAADRAEGAGVVLIDSAGAIVMFDSGCEQIFGYRAGETCGQPFKMLLPREAHEEYDRTIQAYGCYDDAARRKDGSVFPVRLTFREGKLGGEAVAVGLVRDLSGLQQTAGPRLGDIALDFNNILTVILGNSDILRDKLRGRRDLQHYCDAILEAANRGAKMTHDFLAAGRAKPDEGPQETTAPPLASGGKHREERSEIRCIECASAHEGGSETVLVVDDDPIVRAYAVASLEGLGYRVIAAADGREALAKLSQHSDEIDILFSDIVMPGGIGGLELARRARDQKPGLKVLLTSGLPLDTPGTFQPNAKIALLNKPYRKDDLARRFRQVLDSNPDRT